MCLFRLSCGVYVAIVDRTARPLKVKPIKHVPPVLRSRFGINDERPRAPLHRDSSRDPPQLSSQLVLVLFPSCLLLVFSGSAYGIKIALLRSDQHRGLEYFLREKYNIPENRLLQALDACNY